MSNTPRYLRVYRYLKQHWSSITALVSMTGFVFCYLVPPFRAYVVPFILLGANAVIWTLIELKVQLLSGKKNQRYPNMRAARADITGAIRDSLIRKGPLRSL
jgi:hypothetical protein